MFKRTMIKIPTGGYSKALMVLVCGLFISPVATVNAANASVGMTDISGRLQIKASGFRLNRNTGRLAQAITVTNISKQPIIGGLQLVLEGLNQGIQASSSKTSASLTAGGSPVLQLVAGTGEVLKPDEKINIIVHFDKPAKGTIHYQPRVLNRTAP